MPSRNQPEVLIAGAGPVGLLSALVLARRGIRVAVLDQDFRIGIHTYALAIHATTLSMLQQLGVAERLLANSYPIRAIGVYDTTGRRAIVGLPGPGQKFSPVVVLQANLESVLEKALKPLGVDVYWGHKVVGLSQTEGGVRVSIEKRMIDTSSYAATILESCLLDCDTLDVQYVIGADGIRTTVRKLAGLSHLPTGVQYYAVFETRLRTEPGAELQIMLGERTTSALWPMAHLTCRWLFQLLEEEIVRLAGVGGGKVVQLGLGRYPELRRGVLDELLSQRAPAFLSEIDSVTWQLAISFNPFMADHFGKGRIWLAGDSAHMTGPVGMQSVNVGLREGHDLANILADILREGAPSERLSAYNQERIAEWNYLLGMTAHPGSVQAKDAASPPLSDRIISCLPATGNELRRLSEQLERMCARSPVDV
jgi:2-polyprenyl-6-methoxyphenol hydroxylase-like FAD-dependent oxidoreductase